MIETEVAALTDPDSILCASRAVSNGEIAIIPTETVYGMAVDPGNPEAMKKLYTLKGRDAGKPLARFISSLHEVTGLDPVLPIQTRKCAHSFFPGPLTMVVEEKTGVKTGFRMPDNDWTLKFVSSLGISPGVTSTNLSGEPPLTSIDEIKKMFHGKVKCIIDAGTISGTPSTVAEFGSQGIKILRQGDISPAELKSRSEAFILFVCSGNICRSPAAEYFLREILSRRFKDHFASAGYTIESAGTYMFDGYQSPDEIIQVMEEHGVDMSGHRSQPLTEKLLAKSDIVFIMDIGHENYIREMHPAFIHKVRFLDPGGEVPDPYECSMPVIRKTLSQIKTLVMEAAETV